MSILTTALRVGEKLLEEVAALERVRATAWSPVRLLKEPWERELREARRAFE